MHEFCSWGIPNSSLNTNSKKLEFFLDCTECIAYRGNQGLRVCLPSELQLTRKLKAYETIQEHDQLTKVTKLQAEPFALMENI